MDERDDYEKQEQDTRTTRKPAASGVIPHSRVKRISKRNALNMLSPCWAASRPSTKHPSCCSIAAQTFVRKGIGYNRLLLGALCRWHKSAPPTYQIKGNGHGGCGTPPRHQSGILQLLSVSAIMFVQEICICVWLFICLFYRNMINRNLLFSKRAQHPKFNNAELNA